ncbi:MAG: reverse transcriptase domain-containing protein [Bacteroidales bacterium]
MQFEVFHEYFNPDNLLLAFYRVKVWPEELIKDTVGMRAYENNLEVNIKYLSDKICSGQYKPQRPFKYYEPKASGTHRTKSKLMVEDALVYQAIGNMLAARNYEKLEAHNSFIFGSVLHPETQLGTQVLKDSRYSPPFYFFHHWRTFFERFSNSVIKAIEKDKAAFKFETDITGFFDSIPHYNLFEVLSREFNVEDEILDLLSDCLNAWSGTKENLTPGVGIPQGPSPSYLFANMLLYPLDKQLIGSAYKYFRYMDDIKIYSYTEEALRDVLVMIDIYLKGHGLSINSKKTNITPIINHEKDPTVKELKKKQNVWSLYAAPDEAVRSHEQMQKIMDELLRREAAMKVFEKGKLKEILPEDLDLDPVDPDFPEDDPGDGDPVYPDFPEYDPGDGDPIDPDFPEDELSEDPWPEDQRSNLLANKPLKAGESLNRTGSGLRKISYEELVHQLNSQSGSSPQQLRKISIEELSQKYGIPKNVPIEGSNSSLGDVAASGGSKAINPGESTQPEKEAIQENNERSDEAIAQGRNENISPSQPGQTGFLENPGLDSNVNKPKCHNNQISKELEQLVQQTPAAQLANQEDLKKEYLNDPEKIIEFFKNEIKTVEEQLTAFFDKDQKRLKNEDEISDIDFIKLSSRFGDAVGKLKEYMDYSPPENILPLWLFAFKKYFWRARNFVLTLRYYKGNPLLKETLLEHFHAMKNYEYVRFHTISCLNYNFEFCDRELREFFQWLSNETSDLVKYSIYGLLIRHNEDFQLLAALRSQLSGEKNAYLKLWVAHYWDQVEKKLLTRDELMKLAGL